VLETNFLGLERARLLVLDEADRMMALGFSAQLEQLRAALPKNERDGAAAGGRQTLLFSATFPKTVRAIAKQWLAPKPAIVKIESEDRSADRDGNKKVKTLVDGVVAGPTIPQLFAHGAPVHL